MALNRLAIALLVCSVAPLAQAAKTLDIYFIDVEGGQATLIVTPNKQSLLVDTGWPGMSGRDADRIAAAAKSAGVKHVDYLVTTHFHTDHVGGITQLISKLPVRTFVDHGPTVEKGKNATELFAEYEKAVATGKRLTVKPGDTIPMKGLEIVVVTANGDRLPSSLKNGGGANSLCSAKTYPEDTGENARSVGFLLTFGKFRFLNLGDLTSRKELDLVCPENRVGPVDVYLTTHHGLNTSNAQEIVHAVKPRVAVMNNGARKGGSPDAWRIIRDSPGLEDLWQLHFAVSGGKEANTPESMIANLDERCEGKHLKLSAEQTGAFTVMNARNKYQKSYAAR